MSLIGYCLILLLAVASPLAAQKTNDLIRELQRDVALMQDNLRMLNSKFDEKMAVVTTLLQQALDEAKSANKSVAVLDRQLRDSLKEQQNLVAAPVATLGSKVDQMGQDFLGLRESVQDLSARMAKLQAQLTDVALAVKTIKEPPPPPPPATGGGSGGPPPGASAQQVYESALRDKNGGNLDLAMEQFRNYLAWFPNTELAPNAQFYIGEIHYYKENFDEAIQALDQVLEKYPENNKTADALYMKGMALFKSGKKSQAGQVFGDVIKNYPNTDVAKKAAAMRRALGLPVTAPPSAKKRR